jgi:hypothetical protein
VETSTQHLYLYKDVRRLLLKRDRFTNDVMDNAPMNKRPMKLHKGVDNSLQFRVFNPDRTPANICDKSVYARIIDLVTSEIILERKLYNGVAKGFMSLEVLESDLSNVQVGLYKIVLVKADNLITGVIGDYVHTAFYTDYDNNIDLTIEVTDQANRAPKPSIIILEGDWTENRFFVVELQDRASRFYSEALPTPRSSGAIGNLHSFSVYADNYTGKLKVFGTLDQTPNPDIDRGWFNIKVYDDADFIEFIEYTGTRFFSFEGNYMWLKFVYEPDPSENDGSIVKVIARS